jgi:CO/xanthine dehydrogenase Mo-binding subunit
VRASSGCLFRLVEYDVFADLGAYLQLLTPAIPTLTGLMLSGSYRIPAIQINVTGCFTNKMSTDAYRGAGALPEPETEGASSVTIQEIALAAHIARDLPPDTEPGLSATYFFEPKNFTLPFGIVVVEIDRETGDIKFLRFNEQTIAAAAHATDGVDANSDLYASEAYRRHLATVYTRRAIQAASERAS